MASDKPAMDWTGKVDISVPVRLLPHVDAALYLLQKRNESKLKLKRNPWKPSEVAVANADLQRIRDRILEILMERGIRE